MPQAGLEGPTVPVTVILLTYQSRAWLHWALTGLGAARNECPFVSLVVANDPTPEVAADPTVSVIIRHDDPERWHYMARVYDALNQAVCRAGTPWVVLLNSDMYVTDGWLDALWAEREEAVPTSLLVESGQIHSAFPEYVRDFGRTPGTFDAPAFIRHAATIRRPGRVAAGRLFGPALFSREEFLAVGGYPLGYVDGVPGDRILFRRLEQRGRYHLTCLGSVVYHAQEGERRDP